MAFSIGPSRDQGETSVTGNSSSLCQHSHLPFSRHLLVMSKQAEQCTHSEKGRKPLRALLLQKHICTECGGWIRPRPETITIALAAGLFLSIPLAQSEILVAYGVPRWLGTATAYVLIYLATMALLLPTWPWRHISTSTQIEHRYRILILLLDGVALSSLVKAADYLQLGSKLPVRSPVQAAIFGIRMRSSPWSRRVCSRS